MYGLFLTTNIESRQEQSSRAFNSLLRNAKDLERIVATVDVVEDEPCFDTESETFPIDENHSVLVDVVMGKCTGYRAMINNLCRGLEHIPDDELVLYCEDHIVLTHVPSLFTLNHLFDDCGIGWEFFRNIPDFCRGSGARWPTETTPCG